MEKTLYALLAVCFGCSSTSSSSPDATVASKADSFSAHGFSVTRPHGWSFVKPDESVVSDTLVILQGPHGEQALAPAVEFSRRPLSARDQRRSPTHVLTQLMLETAQIFEGFEVVGEPEDIDVGGHSAARIRLKFVESLPDGTSVARTGQFYGIIDGANMFLIRCLGAEDGSDSADFDAIVYSVQLES